jgi:hypothetical protein
LVHQSPWGVEAKAEAKAEAEAAAALAAPKKAGIHQNLAVGTEAVREVERGKGHDAVGQVTVVDAVVPAVEIGGGGGVDPVRARAPVHVREGVGGVGDPAPARARAREDVAAPAPRGADGKSGTPRAPKQRKK